MCYKQSHLLILVNPLPVKLPHKLTLKLRERERERERVNSNAWIDNECWLYHAVMTPFTLQFFFSRTTSVGKSVIFSDTVATGNDLRMNE